MEVPFALNAANTFTGPVEIQRGSVYLGNASALTHTNTLTFNASGGNNARLFLYGNNAVIANLSSPGIGTALIANGNLKNGATVTLGVVNLTVNQTVDSVFSGVITDVFPEYTGSGSGTTGPLNLIKNGTGSLRLAGANSYSGTTTINAGTLEIAGSIGPGNISVKTGATLSGAGMITSPTQVQSGGTLSPGSAIGVLSISNSLVLSGLTSIELNKALTSNDLVQGMTSVTYGGTLSVSNIAGTLAAGDSFKVFDATSYNGTFTNIVPGAPGPWLAWDLSNLTSDGTIRIISKLPQFSVATISGNSIFLSGSGGKSGGVYNVLTSTNIALPSLEWSIVATNLFDASGNFSFSSPIEALIPHQFFRIQAQ